MWGWLETNLKVTDVDIKTEVSQEVTTTDVTTQEVTTTEVSTQEVTTQEVTTQEVTQPADDLVEKILHHMAKNNEDTEATDSPSEEAEWEKKLDRKCERSCNEKYIELVIPRNQALLLFFVYCMNIVLFMYHTGNNVCRG